MRAFVTGVAGFIGSHVAESLLGRGWHVAGCDNLTTGREGNVPEGVLFSRWDIRDRVYVDDCDVVVHCAASYADPGAWCRDAMVNVLGSVNVAMAARDSRAKLVYFQTALPPTSSYAISKIAGGQYIEHALPNDHLTFRLANVYGPRNLSGPIPTFYKRIRDGLACTVVDTSRDIVFVDDVVDAVMLALEDGLVGTFDVCSGRQTSIGVQFEAVSEAMGVDATVALVERGADDVLPEVSVNRNVPGWSAFTKMEDGVLRAVDWYDKHGVERTFTHLKVAGA